MASFACAVVATEMTFWAAWRGLPHIYDQIQACQSGVSIAVNDVAAQAISHARNHAAGAAFFTLCAMNIVPGGAWIGVALMTLNFFAISIDKDLEKEMQTDAVKAKRFPKEYHYYIVQGLGLLYQFAITWIRWAIPNVRTMMRERIIPETRNQLRNADLPIPFPWIVVGVYAIASTIFSLARRNA